MHPSPRCVPRAQLDKYDAHAETVQDWIVDGVALVNGAYADGKRIIAEGANAAMLDVDFGTYPFVTSSSTTVGGIATGLGLSPDKIEACVGVVKAYTTRVGAGGGRGRACMREASAAGLLAPRVARPLVPPLAQAAAPSPPS